jgi:ketosteroid isomerase-like protein
MNYLETFVKEHIEKWVNAWNNHDLKAVLSMYSDDIEFSSPKVKVVFPERKHQKLPAKENLKNIGLRL